MIQSQEIKLSAQYEHIVGVTKNYYEVFMPSEKKSKYKLVVLILYFCKIYDVLSSFIGFYILNSCDFFHLF